MGRSGASKFAERKPAAARIRSVRRKPLPASESTEAVTAASATGIPFSFSCTRTYSTFGGTNGAMVARSTSTARGAKKYRSFSASTRKVNPSSETAMSLKPTSARAKAIRSWSGERDASTVSRYGSSRIGTIGRPMSKATEALTPSSSPRCQLASISSHFSGFRRAPKLNGERTAVWKYFGWAGSFVWRS